MCTTFSCRAPKRVVSLTKPRVRMLEGWLHILAEASALRKNLGLKTFRLEERVVKVLATPPEWQASMRVMSLSAFWCSCWLALANSLLVMVWPS